MRDRLKDALDRVQASDALKRSTQASLARRLRGRQKAARVLRLGTAVCALALCVGVPWLYMTPKPDLTLNAVSAQGVRVGELREMAEGEPTATPTATPTVAPTATPTATPTAEPTAAPTATPTAAPTQSPDEQAACENADAGKHGKNHRGYGRGQYK